jgi:hypothetical protein
VTEPHCHQKAKVSAPDLIMSKTPKRPSQRDDLRQQDGGAGAQRPKSTTPKPRGSPKRKSETVQDFVSTEIHTGVIETSDESAGPSLPPVHDNASANVHGLMAAGKQIGEDQNGKHGEAKDGAKQPAQAATVVEAPAPEEPIQGTTSDPSQSSELVRIRADQKQEPTLHHPAVHDRPLASNGDRKSWSRTGRAHTVQQAVRVWSPHPREASIRVKGASGGVKVWAQERSALRAHQSDETRGSANPLYILAAITLGIPALLLIPLVGLNPGVQDSTFVTVLSFLVLSAFVTAVVFEIKRLVDQPSDQKNH